MDLVVNATRQQEFIFTIDLRCSYIDLRSDLFNTSLVYQHICRLNTAFVDNLNTLYQIFLHILFPESNPVTMQFIKTTVRLTVILFPFLSTAQTTYLPMGQKGNIILERLEILRGKDSAFNFSKTRPLSRAKFMSAVNNMGYGLFAKPLSKVDRYNIERLKMDNIEWVDSPQLYRSKKPWGKTFYQTPANLFEVHVKDFDLVVNPVIQFAISKESDYNETVFLNSRGLELRGRLAKKIGFPAYLTDNQERDPLYVQDWEKMRMAVPGAGFYKVFKGTGYDYFDARGYFTFNVTKYIDVVF